MLGKAAELTNQNKARSYTKSQNDAIRLGKGGGGSRDKSSPTSDNDAHSFQNKHRKDVFYQSKAPPKRVSRRATLSNFNNNIRDESDCDVQHCCSSSSRWNKRLHFITFLAGSNELHCVFEPDDCPRRSRLPKSRSSCCASRCSPEPCPFSPERPSQCQAPPVCTCSKSSLEDSVNDWLRCKERRRLKDPTEKLFGARKCCKTCEPCVVECASDSCCKPSAKCGYLETSPPCCDPMCFTPPKSSCCPAYRKSSTPPSPSLRSKLDDCCYRPACSSSCKLPNCDPCSFSSSKTSIGLSACRSFTETRVSDPGVVKKYKQFRKDYVRKWGIKISNSDGGEWVYKDVNAIRPLFQRKNGKITRIRLADAPQAGCPKKCDDCPKPFQCWSSTTRHRRGSFCRKMEKPNDDKCHEPVVTCYIERACPRTKAGPCFSSCSKCRTSSCPPPASPATCSKSAAAPKHAACKAPPSCMRQPCCMKPSSQAIKISPCMAKSDTTPLKESIPSLSPISGCSFVCGSN